MNYLLDTNIISEIRKRRPHPDVKGWFDTTPKNRRFLSSLSFGEIQLGINRLRRRDPRQAANLDDWLEQLKVAYLHHTIPVTRTIALEWADLQVAEPLPAIDAYLAATAVVHDMVVVTRNVKDFERTGVRLHNPFDPR